MSTLAALQDWYLSQCDDDWEHQYGVRIGTLDNPGWSLRIDLSSTKLSGESFPPVAYGVGIDSESSGNNWLTCKVVNNQFTAYGGPEKLEEMISVFLTWAAGFPGKKNQVSSNGQSGPAKASHAMTLSSIRSHAIETLGLLARSSAQISYEESLAKAGHAPTELISIYCDDLFDLQNSDFIAAFSNEELKDMAMLYGLMRDAFTMPPANVHEMLKTPGWRKVVAFAKNLLVRLERQGT